MEKECECDMCKIVRSLHRDEHVRCAKHGRDTLLKKKDHSLLWKRRDWGFDVDVWQYQGSLNLCIVKNRDGTFSLAGEAITGLLIPLNLNASSFEDAAEKAENLLRETFRKFLSELEES